MYLSEKEKEFLRRILYKYLVAPREQYLTEMARRIIDELDRSDEVDTETSTG